MRWIAEAAGGGAELLRGGERDGALVEPAVVARAADRRRACGATSCSAPRSAIRSFEHDDEALELANDDTLRPGDVPCCTRDIDRALRFAHGLRAGIVRVNPPQSARRGGPTTCRGAASAASGFGNEGVRYAVRDMTEERLVVVHPEEAVMQARHGAVVAGRGTRRARRAWLSTSPGSTSSTARSALARSRRWRSAWRAAGCEAHVRLASSGADDLAAVIDAGVDGVVRPRSSRAEVAVALVPQLRYPPAGARGFGPAPRRRLRPAGSDRRTHASRCTVQIESAAGVEAAAEIARVDGVDALVVGCATCRWRWAASPARAPRSSTRRHAR